MSGSLIVVDAGVVGEEVDSNFAVVAVVVGVAEVVVSLGPQLAMAGRKFVVSVSSAFVAPARSCNRAQASGMPLPTASSVTSTSADPVHIHFVAARLSTRQVHRKVIETHTGHFVAAWPAAVTCPCRNLDRIHQEGLVERHLAVTVAALLAMQRS